jgi:hypothetical protein
MINIKEVIEDQELSETDVFHEEACNFPVEQIIAHILNLRCSKVKKEAFGELYKKSPLFQSRVKDYQVYLSDNDIKSLSSFKSHFSNIREKQFAKMSLAIEAEKHAEVVIRKDDFINRKKRVKKYVGKMVVNHISPVSMDLINPMQFIVTEIEQNTKKRQAKTTWPNRKNVKRKQIDKCEHSDDLSGRKEFVSITQYINQLGNNGLPQTNSPVKVAATYIGFEDVPKKPRNRK